MSKASKTALKNEITTLLKSKRDLMTKTAYEKYIVKLFGETHKATLNSIKNDLMHVTGKNTTVKQIKLNKKTEAQQMQEMLKLGDLATKTEKKQRHMVYNGNEIKLTDLYKHFKGMHRKSHFDVGYMEKLPIRVIGNPSTITSFKMKSNDNLTKQNIQEMANQMSRILKQSGINGKVMTSIRYDKGWRSGYFGTIGEDQVLYDGDDYDGVVGEDQEDNFHSVMFYFYPTSSKGGTSLHNDCLYDCLFQLLGLDLLPFSKPEQLKFFLRLYRDDPVDIALIPRLESKIKIKINVSGDYTYVSNYNSQREINLKLLNGHYTIDPSKSKYVYIPSTEKQLLLYDNAFFIAYDGEKEFPLSYNEYISIVRNETKYRIINRSNPKISLEMEYKQTMTEIDQIKEASKGEINYYKTYNDKNTALTLFHHLTRTVPNPEQISQLEAEWINEASNSALMYHQLNYEGQGYNYDIKSMYPSIMKSRNFLIPIKAGTFEYIERFENNFVRYGIYRAIIKPSSNNDINKLFKFVRNNFYTHYDIRRAMDLNLEIELINDGQANALVYHRDKCITGSELFGQYVDKLFDLKQKKVKRAKAILNILWGALSQKDVIKKDVRKHSKTILTIPENAQFTIRPSLHDENQSLVQYIRNDKRYKTNFARICPFLIAKGRFDISKIMEPYKENLVRCHTDGFILTEEGTNLRLGDDLGDLVFEEYNQHIQIINMNKVIIK